MSEKMVVVQVLLTPTQVIEIDKIAAKMTEIRAQEKEKKNSRSKHGYVVCRSEVIRILLDKAIKDLDL